MTESIRSNIPHPSLSRSTPNISAPDLLHSLHEPNSSILSVAASSNYIFSGNQSNHISVWDKTTFSLKDTLQGHSSSVLALDYAPEKEWLFSSSGDSTIRVWSTSSLTAVYIIEANEETAAGDLFSLIWNPIHETLYVGCQNTSLQWLSFKSVDPGTSTPSGTNRVPHKFFDSYPQHERRPADFFANNKGASAPRDNGVARRQIPSSNVINSAHYGYIYAMALVLESEEHGIRLVTGAGDETLKVWECTVDGAPTLHHEFDAAACGAVYAIVTQGETILAGFQGGHVKVFDLETRTLVRSIITQEGIDILCMSTVGTDLYVGSANGCIQRYSGSFDCCGSWSGHDGIILSSVIARDNNSVDGLRLLTGGNDGCINIWTITAPAKSVTPGLEKKASFGFTPVVPQPAPTFERDTMIYALTKFVSIPSVSSSPRHREDCRQAAIWLKKCLSQLGARTSLLPTGEGKNPLVLGTFTGAQGQGKKPRVLFYGHYDVISAPPEGWDSDPFAILGKNGYLYGRGVTDNKGPIIAVACAASDLLSRRSLEVDLVFVIEGEEECGSTGFEDTIKKHKDAIGPIDAILVSNSTWITDERPCITYGLRGVVHCSIEISSGRPDVHSGLDGGGIAEPMLDMVRLLGTLTNHSNQVQIPEFYDSVRPQSDDERTLYERLSDITQKPASALSSRWSEPSLTIHNIEISGPKNPTVIPGTVKAQVSIRIVPDQSLASISASLTTHLQDSFDTLESPNTVKLLVNHTADWWLGDLSDGWFQALEASIEEEWGVTPLRIREGGSIPCVPYLEKQFGCHALHLPMGQSSDRAHLPNERISVTNLQRGKSIIERFLKKAASMV